LVTDLIHRPDFPDEQPAKELRSRQGFPLLQKHESTLLHIVKPNENGITSWLSVLCHHGGTSSFDFVCHRVIKDDYRFTCLPDM
jgi:hypothetical protein